MPRLALPPFLLLAACDAFRDAPLGEGGWDVNCDGGFLQSLLEDAEGEPLAGLEAYGCGWHIRAMDRAGRLRLTLDVPDFTAALDGEAASNHYVLPHDDVRLTLETGCGLRSRVCGAPGHPSLSVEATYAATVGEVGVSVEADATATVTLTGITFTDEEGDEVPLTAETYTAVLEADPD